METPDLARFARTFGDPTRIRMLTLLMEGRVLTAKELAYGSGVTPATATSHLRRLEDDRFVTATARGRHKHYRLRSPEVARLIESLMVVAPQAKSKSALRPVDEPLRAARFCYDHLAGRLGTRLTQALVGRGLLLEKNGAFVVTARGEAWFGALGLDLDALAHVRRRFAFPCLDWSEREDHLAGALGAALAERLLALGWVARTKRSRIVSITDTGRRSLVRRLGISL